MRAAVFDGFSIGSNDLTQLKLGVDRDSEIVAFDFDEHDPCMSEMLRLAVAGTKRNGRHVGICGEAPAKFRRSFNFSPASVSVAASEGNIAAARGGPTMGADKDWRTGRRLRTRAIQRSRRSISDNVKALGLAAADGYLRVTAEDPDLL